MLPIRSMSQTMVDHTFHGCKILRSQNGTTPALLVISTALLLSLKTMLAIFKSCLRRLRPQHSFRAQSISPPPLWSSPTSSPPWRKTAPPQAASNWPISPSPMTPSAPTPSHSAAPMPLLSRWTARFSISRPASASITKPRPPMPSRFRSVTRR